MFGLLPVDNSNAWDPLDYPSAQLIPTTDFTTAAAQTYLRDFTARARDSWWNGAESEADGDGSAEREEAGAEAVPSDIATNPQWPFNTTFEIAFQRWQAPCGAGLSPSGSCCSLSPSDFPFTPSLCAPLLQNHVPSPTYTCMSAPAPAPGRRGCTCARGQVHAHVPALVGTRRAWASWQWR